MADRENRDLAPAPEDSSASASTLVLPPTPAKLKTRIQAPGETCPLSLHHHSRQIARQQEEEQQAIHPSFCWPDRLHPYLRNTDCVHWSQPPARSDLRRPHQSKSERRELSLSGASEAPHHPPGDCVHAGSILAVAIRRLMGLRIWAT